MTYESMAQALEQLHKLGKTYTAYVHALGVIELDAATAAPSGSWEGRGETTAILSEIMYNLIASPENGKLIAYLKEHAEQLSSVQARELEVLEKQYLQMKRIPAEEYIAFNVLHNDEDSEECVNDTYLNAWNSMPPHRPSVLKTFLGKLTRNISLNK